MTGYSRFLSGTALLVTLLATTHARATNLFDADGFQSMTADRRAAKPGDLITVLVYETSSASNSADTSTNTGFAVNGKVSTLYAGANMAQVGAGDNYGGKGKIERSGRLLAQISATVIDVQANGDLIVSGDQNIDVNGEKTKIRLKGRVRPVDVAQNNTVLSNRLADVQIDYTGEGFITDRSRPGLIPRLFAWLGLW
ncbi:flagellar basal body L-ring protein [Caballeronia pedi]|uniref:Flagellar basal body L-ring protein n=1 Tax=Caballeronia pedi TaxID=1777141 RepID=A0A158C1Q6_9BURK|nr:flagellar basal body L-ring protein FlgH [Caballeronia pedi]SAK75826.1 flagellar basal body L-ring protein [Caballeronia pedi]